jgi:hypothetical protein
MNIVIVCLIVMTIVLLFSRVDISRVDGFQGSDVAKASGFPDCTKCIRYYDTVICKCQSDPAQQDAFLYPTDMTPDVDLSEISKFIK